MNCDCNVPVAIRITKSGTNIGRSYFCCAAGKCSLYGMMTENNALPTHFDPSLYRNKGDLNADKGPKKSSQISVKMALYKIDNFPLPFRIWFTLSHPYNLPLINLYKSLPPDMCKYDESKKLWIFDLEIFETLISHLTSSAFSSFVEVTELPKFLSNGLRKYCHTIRSSSSSLPSAESGDEIKLNICPGLLSKLKSFQVETVKFVLRHGGRAMLGDEMGCGKTAQAIACMQQYVDHWPVLILMPPSLLAQWKGELLKFCSELLSERDICLVSKASDAVDGKVCLVPYTRLQNLVKAGKIRKEQFGVVICDESHNLKSKDSLRTTLALPFLKKAAVALCLTGTPATNRPVELFTQLNGLLPRVFNDYDAFVRRYCDAKHSNFQKGLDVRGSSNEAELKLLLSGIVMIRRLKEEVASELPNKLREVRYIDPDACYLPELKRLKREGDAIQESLKDPRNDAAILKKLKMEQQINLTNQYSTCGVAKIPQVIKEIKELLKEAELINIAAAKAREESRIIVPENAVISLIEDDVLNNEDALDEEEDILFQEPRAMRGKQKKAAKTISRKAKNMKTNPKGKAIKGGLLSAEDSSEEDCDLEEEEDDSYCSDRDIVAIKWKGIFHGKGKPKRGRAKAIPTKGERYSEDTEEEEAAPIGHKVIVFAHHKAVMDALEASFIDLGVCYVRVDGDVSQSKRDVSIRAFQEDNCTHLALLSVTACGTGLNLTRANIAVFAELCWSHGAMLQAEDRIHRMGQMSDSVRIVFIIARNTSDEMMWRSTQNKHDVLAATVGVAGKAGSGMNARAVASVESQGKCVQQSVDSFVQLTANPRRIPLPYETSGSAAPLSTDMKIDDYFRPCNQVNAETKVDELEVYDSCSAMFQYTAASNASSHSEESSLPPPVPVGNTSPLKSTSFQSDPYRSTLQISAPSNSALELPIPSTSVPKVLSPATKARIERNKEIALARRGQIISTANPLNQPSLPPALPPGTPAIISQKNNIPPIPTLCCPLEPSLCLQSFTFAASNTCDSRKLQNTSCIPDFSHNEKCASSSFTPAAGFQFTSGGGKTVTVSAEAMANVSATYKMTTPTTCSTNAFPAAQESLNGFLKTMPATNFNQGERVGRSID